MEMVEGGLCEVELRLLRVACSLMVLGDATPYLQWVSIEMNRLIRLLAFSAFVIVTPLQLAAAEDGIKVIGTAKVSAVPDIARFTFAVDARGRDLSALKAGIDDKTAKVIALAKQLGVMSKEISSSAVAIHPQYDYQSREFLGYEVSREVKITLNDLEKYAALLDGAIYSGITTIRGISLDTSKRDDLEIMALQAASQSARKKAEALANSNGVVLGKVLRINEGGASFEAGVQPFAERAMLTQGGGSYEPGEISVSATVMIEYAIQ
jgi:hypothetical protein